MVMRVEWTFAGYSTSQDAPDIRWTEKTAMLGARGGGTISVSVEIHHPEIDIREAVFSGAHQPEEGTATLYQGDVELMAGRWSNVELMDGRRTKFQLRSGNEEDRAVIPSETLIGRIEVDPEALDRRLSEFEEFEGRGSVMRVVQEAFTAASRKYSGRIVPFVVGGPGNATYPGSPGLTVDTSSTPKKCAIHAGRLPTGVTAGTLWGPDGSSGSTDLAKINSDTTAVLTSYTDALGRVIGVSDYGSGSSNVNYDDEGEYHFSWTNGDASPGGAGDVCITFLRATSVRWDAVAWEAIRDFLNGYTLGGYIDKAVSPLRFLERQVFPLLPLDVVPGPRGLRPALYPWVIEGTVGGRSLEVGPGFARAGPVKRLSVTPRPSVEFRYGWDPSDRAFRYRVVEGPDTNAASARGSQFAGAPAKTIDANMVWDGATAHRMAREMVLTGAEIPYDIPYTCDPERYGPGGDEELSTGDVVSLTDSDIGLTDAQAVVGAVERSPGRMRVSMYVRA